VKISQKITKAGDMATISGPENFDGCAALGSLSHPAVFVSYHIRRYPLAG